jgi:hypothetical protein
VTTPTRHDARVTYEFDAELWLWDARKADSWTFLSVPPEFADEILEIAGPYSRGFGSVRVEVSLGGSVWRTSIFPDSRARTYVLPVKKAIRHAEKVGAGDTVAVRLTLVDLGRDAGTHAPGPA